jgi:hypothetical protein
LRVRSGEQTHESQESIMMLIGCTQLHSSPA